VTTWISCFWVTARYASTAIAIAETTDYPSLWYCIKINKESSWIHHWRADIRFQVHPEFWLAPKSTTLVDLEWPLCALLHYKHILGAHHKIWMKIDPQYQRQKCSPGILVPSKIRSMQIFVGVRCRGASNNSTVVENGDFSALTCYIYLPNFQI